MEHRHEIINFSNQVPGKVFLHKLGSVPKHWHRSIEVLFVLVGQVDVVIDDKAYTLKSTDIIVINSLSTHELYSDGAELLAFQINLSKTPSFESFKDYYFDCCSYNDTDNPRYENLRHLLARLIKENSTEENVLVSHSLIALLLNELVTNFQTPRPENIDVKKKALSQMTQITDFINLHYREGLSLADVAAQFHFSPSYLSRIFKQHLGMNYFDYYNTIRLDHAVNEMLTSTESIATIAVNNGFPDARSMTALFKKKYGMLPSEYRSTRQTIVPKDKTKNEINYLSLTTSDSLSSLAKYLREPEAKPSTSPSDIPLGQISVTQKGSPLRHTWRRVCCVGSSRDLLYTEVQDMLRKMQKEMPFTYVKFHGILSDDMLIYGEDMNGQPVLSFQLIDKVFDFLLSIGLKPWMQLAFMPSLLASDPKKTTFYTRHNCSLPKDMDKWTYLIHNFVMHLIRRYSLQEVLSWPFCVWNEPDTTEEMFGFADKESFFPFYEATYRTIKNIHPDFIFGSPSLLFLPEDQLDWYHPFFDYCKSHDCFPDFLNLHYYDDDIALPDRSVSGERPLNKLTTDPRAFDKYLDHLFAQAPEYGLEGVPVYMTEWNLTVSHRNLINDTCYKACYLIKNLVENYDRLESFGYWSLTDLIEETQLPNELFHGGLGLFTSNGVPKAHYYAFLLASKLGNTLVDRGDGYFLTKDSCTGDLKLLLYNYYHFDNLFASGQTFDMTQTNRYTAFSNLQPRQMNITLTDMVNGDYEILETFVNRDHGSCYDTWVRMGGEELEDAAEVDFLYHNSYPGRYKHCGRADNNVLEYSQVLEPFEVRIVEIKNR